MNRKELIEYERRAYVNAVTRALMSLCWKELGLEEPVEKKIADLMAREADKGLMPVEEEKGIGPVVVMNRLQFRDFLISLTNVADADSIYEMRFAINDGGLKVKANNRPWSPKLGKLDES